MQFASLPLSTALRLIGPFGFGFFLSMFTRTLSNMVKQPIQLELGLGEEAVGLALGTSFFLAFGLMQLPVGVLVDRYDPRRVNALMFLLAAVGSVVMAFSYTSLGLTLGRALMGVGFAAGLMASLKIYAMWFPREKLVTLNSVQFMIGVLGAWCATKPVEYMLAHMDWRDIYLMFAVITVLAAAIMMTVSPLRAHDGQVQTLGQQLRGLLGVYRDAYFWRLAPWMFVAMGISQGLSALYLFSWFTDVAEQPSPLAASNVTLITLVSVLNFALLGPLSEWLERRGHSPLLLPVVAQLGAIVCLGLLAAQVLVAVVPQWIAWTMLVGTSTLAYAVLARSFPLELVGRVYTAFNLLGFMTTALVQWFVGMVLDSYPTAQIAEGYQVAFLGLMLLLMIAAGWFGIASRLSRQ